ncbi:MAG: hypothetical protein RL217_284 [Pseudomonadota bacterium]|jgi:AraC-like DNA-binding protein
MTALGLVSPPALAQYLRFAQAQGLERAWLLEQIGLSEEQLGHDNPRIAGEKLQALIALLLKQTGLPVLGLISGDFVEPHSYSVLGFITMNCTTLGEAIMRIAPFEKLVGDMGTTQVQALNDEIHLHWHCTYPNVQVREQMVDNVFASWIAYARWLGNADTEHPVRVELTRTAPAPAYAHEYQQRWHCPVLFNCPANKIIIEKSLLARPLRQPNPELRQNLEQHAQTKLANLTQNPSFKDLLTSQIQQLLNAGQLTQNRLAQRLNISLRTLQRRMTQEGLSYQSLVDNERKERACTLLRHSGKSSEDIAQELGFIEVTSFYRSFKKWTGMTPAQFRKAPSTK